MERVTIYLRTSLYSIAGDNPHVPNGVMTLEGAIADRTGGGLLVDVSRFIDGRGRDLKCAPMKLYLPMSKVDHAVVHDA